MNASTESFPPARVTPGARQAFGGIWRLSVRQLLTPGHWLAVGGMLVALGVICVGNLTGRNAPALYINWVAEFYIAFVVPTLAFIAGAEAIRDEMKARSADYILTRPLSRPRFVLFRFVAQLGCAELDFLAPLALVLGIGQARGVLGIAAAIPAFFLAQVLMVAAFTALGFLAGMLTSRYIVVGLLYAAVVEIGVGQIPTQLSRLSLTHQVKLMLQDAVAAPGALTGAAGGSDWGTAGLVVLVCAVAIGVTAVLFNLREFTGAAES